MVSQSGNQAFLREFAEDSRELFEEIESATSRLYQAEADELGALCKSMRDLFEAIKGSADFLEITPISKLAAGAVAQLKAIETKGDLDLAEGEQIERWTKSLGLILDELIDGRGFDPNDPRAAVSSSTKLPESEPEPMVEEEAAPFEPEFQITITPEMLETFLSEAEEQLEASEESLLSLEKNLNDAESVDRAFRAIHTLKGNSGLFGFAQLERLGHQFESILEEFKSGELKVDQKGVTVLLRCLDVMKSTIHELPDGGGKVASFDDYLKMLSDYRTKGHVVNIIGKSNATMLGEILVEMNALPRAKLDEALRRQGQSLGEILRELNVIDIDQLEQALEVQRQRREKQPENVMRKREGGGAQNIRVDLFKLDGLMNLVGELIIAENMVTHNPDLVGHDFENFRKAAHQLNRITRELQDISMSLRMIPIEGVFHKMVRVVRDVSQKRGKLVELIMTGEDTEVDKSVAEEMSGPLLHIIRNAIDHGVETPNEREQQGKDKTGKIHLRAFHQGGEVVIEVEDDGKGMDPDKILAKAREKGVVGPIQEFSNPQEILNLIFEAGFSTAEKVTDISGRGVGMDVVRRNLEKINGRIHMNSAPGQGSLFSIRIPLTLAIIEGMLIRIGHQLFTIPLLSVRETLQASQDMISYTIDGSEMVRIRKELIPIIRLHQALEVEPEFRELTQGILVMVETDAGYYALFADEIRGQYQTVIKGLSGFFGAVRGITGTSILSNGDISLILDIQSLVDFSINHEVGRVQLEEL